MASVKNIFDISGRAMDAKMIRLNTVESNLANSNNISTTSEGAYRPLKPIFKTIYSNKLQNNGMATVDAINVQELNREPERVYMPDHPKADEDTLQVVFRGLLYLQVQEALYNVFEPVLHLIVPLD